MRRLAQLMVAMGVSGCGFAPAASDGVLDASVIDSPLVDAMPPVPRWAVVGVTNTTGASLVIHPFDAHFGSPCAKQTAPAYSYRSFLAHPSLPYVYGIESELWGISLGCASVGAMTLAAGGPRPIQRVALDPTAMIGFFTADGSLATSVYRFTAQADGTPIAVAGSANGFTASGALALEMTDRQLFVAGTNGIYEYALVGTALNFPGSGTTAPTCAQPVDLLPSGGSLLAFCADVPEIQRYTRSPFAVTANAGVLGTVSQVVALPNDRAIAALTSPASLVIMSLGAGSPTWLAGPVLQSPATAMAVSVDGQMLVTARQVDSATSELAAWKVADQSLSLVDSQLLDGTVTSLAVTAPGS